jgi:iron complex outermembrane recepter protein
VQTPRDGKLRAMFGGYYFESNDDQGFTVNTTFGNANFGRVSGFNSLDKVENTAVFGLVEWDASERLTFSGEARYQTDDITGSREVSVLGGIGQPSAVRNTEFKSFLPRVTARYALEAGWNLYGSVAKGNKPGGFNDLPTDANAAAIALFEERNYDEFDEEQVWSYELGTKGQLGRIYFNAAIYYLDWTKQQLTQSQPYQRVNGTFTTFPFITNAGQSEIKGLEIEISGPVTTWLDLRLGYSLNDAKFKDFYDVNQEELLDTDGQPSYLSLAERTINPRDVDGPNGQVSGNRLPQTPQHQAIFTADVHFPALTNAMWFLRSDLAYDSKRYVQTHNLAHTGSSINLNLRTGLEWQDVTFTLYVNNATDDDTPLVGTRLFDFNRFLSQPDPNPANANARRTTFYRDFLVASPRKREFGMTATWKF